jgi:hypothetical protein
MAGTITILIGGCSNMDQLVAHLEQIVGHRFEKSQNVVWSLYKADALRVHISVFDNDGFENVQGIEFTRFSFVIDIQGLSAWESNVYYGEWLRLVPLLLASMLSQELDCECVVVEDFYRIVKTFGAPNEE